MIHLLLNVKKFKTLNIFLIEFLLFYFFIYYKFSFLFFYVIIFLLTGLAFMTSWKGRFFNTQYHTENDKLALFEEMKQAVQSYELQKPKPIISKQRAKELDNWYYSQKGQQQLITLFNAFWTELSSQSIHAMPSHDARHALFKTPCAALETIYSEGIHSWERIGFLGALLHDWGRWAEEAVYGEPTASMAHARMSFLLSQEFLAQFDLPSEIVWHLLQAVVVHTVGSKSDDDMITKITVSSDRMQLWGPEFILRIFHHIRKHDKDHLCYAVYDPLLLKDHTSNYKNGLFFSIENMYKKRFSGPLHQLNEHLRKLRTISFKFCYLAGTRDYQKNILTFAEAHQNWLPINYHQAVIDANTFRKNCTHEAVGDPRKALSLLFDAKNLSPNISFTEDALKRVTEIPEEFNQSLSYALLFAYQERQKEEQRLALSIEKLLYHYQLENKDPFICHILKHYVDLS